MSSCRATNANPCDKCVTAAHLPPEQPWAAVESAVLATGMQWREFALGDREAAS